MFLFNNLLAVKADENETNMKKLMVRSVFAAILLLGYGVSFGQNVATSSKKANPVCTVDCSKHATAVRQNKASLTSQTSQTAKSDCPLKGTADCPLLKDCPLKGTANCPLVKPSSAVSYAAKRTVVKKDEKALPPCCQKKMKS